MTCLRLKIDGILRKPQEHQAEHKLLHECSHGQGSKSSSLNLSKAPYLLEKHLQYQRLLQ